MPKGNENLRASFQNQIQISQTVLVCSGPYNKEARRKIHTAIEEYDALPFLVKKRKLKWFGHVSMSSASSKTNLQGTMKGNL